MDLIPRSYFLEDVFDNFLTSHDQNFKCDIYEKEGKYYIEADIPGFKKDDIKVEFNRGYLTIKAIKKEETKDKDKNYIRRERKMSSIERSFYLGDIEQDHINASFENGALLIEVPKADQEKHKKQIEIK